MQFLVLPPGVTKAHVDENEPQTRPAVGKYITKGCYRYIKETTNYIVNNLRRQPEY